MPTPSFDDWLQSLISQGYLERNEGSNAFGAYHNWVQAGKYGGGDDPTSQFLQSKGLVHGPRDVVGGHFSTDELQRAYQDWLKSGIPSVGAGGGGNGTGSSGGSGDGSWDPRQALADYYKYLTDPNFDPDSDPRYRAILNNVQNRTNSALRGSGISGGAADSTMRQELVNANTQIIDNRMGLAGQLLQTGVNSQADLEKLREGQYQFNYDKGLDAARSPWAIGGGIVGGAIGAYAGGPMGAAVGASAGSNIGAGIGGMGYRAPARYGMTSYGYGGGSNRGIY